MFKYLWIVIVLAVEITWLVGAVKQIYDEIKWNKIFEYPRPVKKALKDDTILRAWVLYHIVFLFVGSLINFLRG